MKELDQRKYLNGRLKELIIVALNTGMRLTNIAGMKRGNVRMENRTIPFGKNEKTAYNPNERLSV